MAITKLVDVVEPQIFANLVEAKVTDQSRFRNAGIVASEPQIQAAMNDAGFSATLPMWNAVYLAGNEAASASDDETVKITPQKVSQTKMQARKLTRAVSFSFMDVSAFATPGDAVNYAVNQVSRLWIDDEEYTLLACVKGLLADNVANDSGDLVSNLSITTGTIGAGNKISASAIINARAKKDEYADQLNAIIMHPDIATALRLAEPNNFIPASQTDIGLARYMGFNVIESRRGTLDTTVANFPVYSSYFAGAGLFGYGIAAGNSNSLAFQRDELAGNGSGQETFVSRRQYLLHPLGLSNNKTPSNGITLTNAELGAASGWDRVVPDKYGIPLVVLKTNG